MIQVDPTLTRHKGLRRGILSTLAIATATGASVVTIALPAISYADPEPAPPPSTTAAPASPAPTSTAASPAPRTTLTTPPPGAPSTPVAQPNDPNATPVPPVDPNAPVPPADPNAPPPPVADPGAGQVSNAVGGFTFIVPPGWVESDASHLDYGSALLSKTTGQPTMPDQPPPVANDTRIVLGRLDQKLYASAEATNPKAALRLGSDMGEFFMPYPGTRINQETVPLNAAGLTGSASYYEVKFSDTTKPNGQIWTGVIGAATQPTSGPPQRWFVVWLGTANNPVDKNAARALAESIRPWTPPAGPAPEAAPAAPGAPGAPAAPAPAAPAPVAPAPVPGQAPAGEVTPTASPTPQRSQPA
jgi:hypothetical protein